MTTSHLVLGSAGLLLVIGLVMVFSASSIEAAKAGLPAWLPGVRQIAFALVGLVGMLIALRLPIGRLRQWSGRGMLTVFVLLAVVMLPIPGLTLELNGARAWFNLGFTNFQPSELGKLVFALWGAHHIASREKYLTTRSLLTPVLPAFVLMSLLLLAEPDMGAVVSLLLVVAGLMWAGGLSRRYIAWAVVAVAAVVTLMVAVAPYRMARVTGFIDPCADASDSGYQACHGLYALATGGFWGVGLGNSAMKWNLLPHAESDYIFAILGEELGFLGCLVVVTLYAILGWAGFRIARRSTDRFVQLASIAITVWLIGQATMNMGYVVGLLPVTGVTLPLISAGGTSLVLTLFVIGLLARFARSEPAAIAFQRAQHRGRLARLLLPVPPAAVDPVPPRRRRRPADARGTDPRGTDPRDPRRAARSERSPGRTLARVPDDRRRAEPRRPAEPNRPPEERWRGPERQTVPGRQPAGDRPSDPRRPAPAAGPVPRDLPRERPRSGEPPAARVRPVPRSRPTRTERPGRLQ
jgi:cell division protein FtsW